MEGPQKWLTMIHEHPHGFVSENELDKILVGVDRTFATPCIREHVLRRLLKSVGAATIELHFAT